MTAAPPLRGAALRLAQLIWLACLALAVVVFVLGLVHWYPRLQQPCREAALVCQQQMRVSPADAAALQATGWALPAYALFILLTRSAAKALGAGLGLVIFWRRPTDRMALLTSLFLIIGIETSIADALAATQPIWWLPTRLLGYLGALCFPLFFYLFPSGRFYPRWTVWPALLWAGLFVPVSFFPASSLSINHADPRFVGAVFFLLVLTMIGAQVQRYRRLSSLTERLQTKWVVFATVLSLVGVVLALVSVVPLQGTAVTVTPYWMLTDLGFQLITIVIPLSLGVAILRYRLWDIDILIRRTLVYSALTAFLALAYFGSVLVLQNLFQTLTGEGQNTLATVLSTLIIAALFGPVRGRVQRVIDRRFYRQKYNAAHTLAAFSAQARDVVELDQLSDQLVQAVDTTMQPAHVGLWMRQEPGR